MQKRACGRPATAPLNWRTPQVHIIREEKEEEEKDRTSVLPLYRQHAAHGGGGGGRGRLFNHPCGWAVGGGRRGGDSQAHCHALICVTLTTETKRKKKQKNIIMFINSQINLNSSLGDQTISSPVGDWPDSIRPTFTTWKIRGGVS